MAGDGNAFTQICSVIESSQEVVWYNQTNAVRVLALLACLCGVSLRAFFFFFLAQMKVFAASEALFALLPFAACATLTIHVICMCVLEMRLCVLSAACVLSLV